MHLLATASDDDDDDDASGFVEKMNSKERNLITQFFNQPIGEGCFMIINVLAKLQTGLARLQRMSPFFSPLRD